MSGHLRFCFAAFVLLAAFPTSPASSNPFADFFNAAPAPAQATAPAAAEAECLPRPGKSTTSGQRWVYRFDGHRKCWFQTAQGIATVKKQVRHSAAKPPVAVPEENEAAPRKQKAVVDARAELLRSAPAEASQPTRLAPEFKVVDAASVLATGTAAFVPPAPIEKLALLPNTPRRDRSTWRRFCRPHRPPETRLPPPCLKPGQSPFLSPRQPMTGRAGWQPCLACC